MLMAGCFAVNHGVVTTPLAVATSTLGMNVAAVGNGLLYVFTLFSSLLLGAPATASLGPKNSLSLGMLLYTVYAAGFGVSASLADGSTAQWTIFTLGSACGGVAAGILWTAQGSFFAGTATRLAEASGSSREAATSNLATSFASLYLGFEVASKLAFSALRALGLDVWVIGALYTSLGAAALLSMERVHDVGSPGTREPKAKLAAAVSLWSDPVIWLLAPTNLAFSFSSAYMNGYVNGTYATQELGGVLVGFLSAMTALAGAVLVQAYRPLGDSAGKGPVVTLGAISLFCIPLLSFTLSCCNGWGWWLLSLYLLQGSGRAVYESTNRAIFSDFFPGEKTEGAFANCMLQSSAAFAACFFLQTSLSGQQLETIIVGLTLLAPVGYVLAQQLRSERLAQE